MSVLKIKKNGEWVAVSAGTQGPVGPVGPAGAGSGDMLASVYDPQGKAQDVFGYVDGKLADIPTPDVSGQINAHNADAESHNDVRLLITELTNRLNTLANSDDTTLDQMAEVVDYIKDNRELIEQITTGKISVSDIIDNLTTNVSNKPLSAAQGVALKALADAAASAASAAQSTANSKETSGTAASAVSTHNTATDAHSDIRTAVSEAATAATQAETNAKSYTDQKIAAIPTPDVSGQINAHNASSSAHSDIRAMAQAAQDAVAGKAPMYYYGTSDVGAGSASPYPEGSMYLVYE